MFPANTELSRKQGLGGGGGGYSSEGPSVFGPFVSMAREALAGCIMPKYGEGLCVFSVDFRVWYYDVGGPGDSGKGCFPS